MVQQPPTPFIHTYHKPRELDEDAVLVELPRRTFTGATELSCTHQCAYRTCRTRREPRRGIGCARRRRMAWPVQKLSDPGGIDYISEKGDVFSTAQSQPYSGGDTYLDVALSRAYGKTLLKEFACRGMFFQCRVENESVRVLPNGKVMYPLQV